MERDATTGSTEQKLATDSFEEALRFVVKMRFDGRPDVGTRAALLDAGWSDEAADRLLNADQATYDAATGNNSGAGAPPSREIPARRWSWGAFALTWYWGIANRVWVALLALPLQLAALAVFIKAAGTDDPLMQVSAGLALLALGFSVWLGLRGHALAWSHRRFDSPHHFRRQMRNADSFGLGLFGVAVEIAILAAVIFPVLKKANERSREATCQSTLNQLGLALLTYSQDHQGRLPAARGWRDATFPYSKITETCPDQTIYLLNPRLSGDRVDDVKHPDRTVLIYEGDEFGNLVFPHRDGMNVCFVDGHVKWIARSAASQLVW